MVLYEATDDIFSIAGMYVEALARGHVFVDANKRTALLTGLAYLSLQGVDVPAFGPLEDLIVKVAEGKRDRTDVAIVLHALCLPALPK